MAEKDPAKFETRRRWLAMMKDGSIAALRSEGRLVALYVFYAADWTSGEVRFSMRRIASMLGVQPTTVRRGISQLLDRGILEILGKPEGAGATLYGVCERAPLVRAPDTSRAQSRTRAVRSPDTSGAQSAHEPCAVRTRPVRGLRTLCARNTINPIGSSLTTNGDFISARPDGGQETATAVPNGSGDGEDSAAGLTGDSQQRQEDVA